MNETSSQGKKIHSALRLLIAAAIFCLALMLRWAPGEPIPPFDDLYHAKRIAFSAKHFPRVLDFDPDRGLAGAFCPWPPLYDLTCAALSHVVDVRWLPPVGFALFVALVSVGRWPLAPIWSGGGGGRGGVGRRVGVGQISSRPRWLPNAAAWPPHSISADGRGTDGLSPRQTANGQRPTSIPLPPRPTANGQRPTIVLALGLALSPYLIGISRTSHIDHHWVEPMLMLAIVFATRARRGVALGIALAAALLVQPAFLVAAALAFVALFLDDAHEEGLRAFAIAAIAVVAYRVTRPHGYPDSAWFLGWPHAAALLGGAAAFIALSHFAGRRKALSRIAGRKALSRFAGEGGSEAKRRTGVRGCSLAIGALVTLSFPQTATALLTGSTFFGSDPWLSSIVEFQPMFHDRAAIGTDLANLTGGALLAFVLIRRERTVALFAIAYLVLALTSRRFLVPGIALFVLAGALAMMHARTRLAAIACAALTLIPPLAYDIATRGDPWPNYDHIYRRAAAIRNLPPGRVLAPWSYGHAIDVLGEHPVILDNFGSMPNAMEFDDATFALHAGGRALERYVRAHRVIDVISGKDVSLYDKR